jgi:hypothetical protein
VLAVFATPFLGVLPTLGIFAGLCSTWWLAKQNAVKPYPAVSWTVRVCGPIGTLITAIPYAESLNITDKGVFLTVGLFLLAGAVTAAAVGYNLEYAKRDKS